MKITLYTTHCPQCDVLEGILKENKIEYETITDTEIMREKHILLSSGKFYEGGFGSLFGDDITT